MSATPSHAAEHVNARSERLYIVDGLRLMAALAVVAYHFTGTRSASTAWGEGGVRLLEVVRPVSRYGWIGVELFFMISGFVICMSCWGRTLRDFAISRVVRLYPAYWIAIAVLVVVKQLFTRWTGPNDVGDAVVNLTMLHEPLRVPAVTGVFWTLWVEMRFYLLFAVVVWRGLTYSRVIAFSAAWLVLSGFAVSSKSALLESVVVPAYSAYFTGGIGLYLVYRCGSRLPSWLLIFASWAVSQHFIGLRAEALGVSPWLAVCALTACYILLAAIAMGWLGVTNRLLTSAGALTYPLYLTHAIPGLVVIRLLAPRLGAPWVLAVVTSSVLGLAWVIHRGGERPIASLLKRALSDRQLFTG